MEEDVTFSDPPQSVPEGDLEFLPYNYLPAALPAIAGDSSARSRIVMTFPQPVSNPETTDVVPRFDIIHPELLASPEQTAAFLKGLQDSIGADFIPQPWFLGPPTDLRHEPGNLRTLDRGEPLELANQTAYSAAVVVIDTGIAFWNRRFQDPDGPRFHAIRFFDFGPLADAQGNPVPATLGRDDIRRLCNEAEKEDGYRKLVQKLRFDYPGSFYGSPAAEDLDGLWHGTAMADLAAGHSGGSGKRIALFGLELPTAMVQDYSGDSLTISLPAALNAALAMTTNLRDVPVTILLPYAFSGGPQDDTHPDRKHRAAKAIENFLTFHGRSGLKVVVSAGNMLQDRLRARLPGTPPAGTPLKLDWWDAPDDFSINTVEALIDNVAPMNDSASLDVKAPTNETAFTRGLTEGQFRKIRRGGAVVGSIMRFKNDGTMARLRLSLMPTGYRGTEIPAPHGRWVLSTRSSQAADLWILRDDTDSVFDREYPRRPSYFDHPMYRPTNKLGEPGRGDDLVSPVMRSGTLSPLGTAFGVDAVQADEMLGNSAQRQAEYSGKPEQGVTLSLNYLVDDGWVEAGVPAAANGSDQRVRVSGTSAAAALHVRDLIGLGGPPEL